MVVHFALAAALLLQQAPEITVGIRPTALRVGGRAVLSVRVLSSGGLPEWVEFVPPAGLEVEDVRDRTSRGVGTGGATRWALDREIHLLAREPGDYPLPPVQVVVGGVPYQATAPRLSVTAVPLQWAPPPTDPNPERRRDDRSEGRVPRDQGTPPATGEMGSASPGSVAGYAPWGTGYAPPFGYPWTGTGYPVPYPGGGGYPTPYPGGGYSGGWPVPGGGGWGGSGGWWGSAGGWYGYPPTPYGPHGGWPVLPPGGMPGAVSPGGVLPGNAHAGGGAGGYPPGSTQPVPTPGSALPGGTPTLLPPPGGRWPEGMGGGWAETAAGDPWWPEIVPELHAWGATSGSPAGEVTLSVGVTPIRLFAGQQATLVASAAFAPGAFLGSALTPEYLPPSPPDFWTVDLPDPPSATAVAAGGGVEQAYTFRRALFPMRAGEHVLPSARLLLPKGTASVPTWDTVTTAPLPLTVLPIPRVSGLPGYAGAVGRYRLEAAVTPDRLAVGETALLVVRILGVGNVSSLPPPELGPIYGAEIAPGGDGAVVEVRDGVVGGVRTFTWLVVPTQPGPLTLGPVLFAWFDPYLGDFGQAASRELILEVTEVGGVGGGGVG